MKVVGYLSPISLVGLSGVGCLILFLADSAVLFHVLSRGTAVLTSLALTGLGMAVTWLGWERLNDGIRNETWTEQQIAHLRRFLEHRAISVLQWLMVLAIVAM